MTQTPLRVPSDVAELGASIPYPDLIPEEYFRNSLDLNRFSNKVSREIVQSYNRIIVRAVDKLEAIERLPLANQPRYTAARLRSLLLQTKASLKKWDVKSTKDMQLVSEGVAKIQAEFATAQMEKALPAGIRSSIRTVEVTPAFAKAVVNTSASEFNLQILSDSLNTIAGGSGVKFSLTAKEGALIRLPNGESIRKSFRGITNKSADKLGREIRDGLLAGDTTQQIRRRLIGELRFNTKANARQMAAMGVKAIAKNGGTATKAANFQIMTLVRTSLNQVSNVASQQVYKANPDATKKYRYLATLDTRTSSRCRLLDQQIFEYGKGPEPPQHFNCRSRTVAEIDYDNLSRVFGRKIEAPRRRGFRPSESGLVPAGESYGTWLSKQSTSIKAKALGEKKVRFFDKLSKKYGGDQAIRKFVSVDGSEKTLAQLQAAYGKKADKIKSKPKPKAVLGTAVASDFIKSKPIEKLSNKEQIKNIKAYKKHLRDTAKAQGKKISPFDLGPYDTQIERLEQGLTPFDMRESERMFTSSARLDYLYWRQKTYNKKPIRVKNIDELKKRTDVVKAADGENLIIYRGLDDKKFAEQFKGIGEKSAEHYAGNGIYGNGSYGAARNIHGSKSIVNKANNDALALAKQYAGENEEINRFLTKAQTNERVTAFALRKDANVKTWKAGSSVKTTRKSQFHAGPDGEWYEENFVKWKEETIAKAEKLTGLKYNSIGEAATALGIDAYQVPLPLTQMDEVTKVITRTTYDYWVILNRSAIIVSDTVGL